MTLSIVFVLMSVSTGNSLQKKSLDAKRVSATKLDKVCKSYDSLLNISQTLDRQLDPSYKIHRVDTLYTDSMDLDR